jgi:hypothetical protein
VEAEAADAARDDADLANEIAQKRTEHQQKQQTESDGPSAKRKRRRRMVTEAEATGNHDGEVQRFRSETTLDESKAILGLDNNTYQELRQNFENICKAANIVKKTTAGPDQWAMAQQRLIRENSNIRVAYANRSTHPTYSPEDFDRALEAICTDVTKRLRFMLNRITLVDAKSILNLNPEQSREVRKDFFDLLKKQNFKNKVVEGSEVWEVLKRNWIRENQIMSNVMAKAENDPNGPRINKAIEVLCRDVMKRWRDEQYKLNPERLKLTQRLRGPGPAKSNSRKRSIPSQVSQPVAPTSLTSTNPLIRPRSGIPEIDPSLILAATSDPSYLTSPSNHQQANHGQYQQQIPASGVFNTTHEPPSQNFLSQPVPPSRVLPVYFRLSTRSPIQTGKRLWLSSLRLGTLEEIRTLAVQHHPGAVCTTVEGSVKDPVAGEVVYVIDDEDELAEYLEHASSAGGKITFLVSLQMYGHGGE